MNKGKVESKQVIGKASTVKTDPDRYCTARTYEPTNVDHAHLTRPVKTTKYGPYV